MKDEKTPVILPKYELPTMSELLSSDVGELDKVNKLNILLNQAPPVGWLKIHPMNNKLRYLPIERVEYLLTRIFFEWKVEIKSSQLIGNSVVVAVRLHYFNPVTDKWFWQDGIGAAPLQTDKGAGAVEFNKLKDNAVMLAAPAAESYAVKDAAHKIGAIFGKNLNREDKANYDSLAGNVKKESDLESKFTD